MDSTLHRQHQQALLVLLGEFDRICKVLEIPYVLFAGTMLGAVRHKGFIPWDDDLDVLMMREDYRRFLEEAESVLDREKFYLQKEFSPHWPMFFSKLRLNHTACLEKFHPKDPMQHQGIYIDIFPCDNAAKSEFGRRMQFYASKVVIAKSLDRRGYDTDSKGKKLFIGLCRILPMKPFLSLTQMGREDSEKVHSFLAAAHGYSKNVYLRRYFARKNQAEFEGGRYPIPACSHELLTLLYGDYLRLPPPEERALKQHAILVDPEHSYEQYADYRDGMKFDVHTRSIR